jgi:hypothetical protein
MARHIFVVARGHRDLYEVLAKQFIDDGNVRIILDRRLADRRQDDSVVVPHGDRRAARDRRTRPKVDEELKWRSHAIITLDE